MNDALFSSKSCEWETPPSIFEPLNDRFHFTLDPCSTDENAKTEKHYTKEQDGLKQDWSGEVVFCNPPYGRGMAAWIKKCYEHYIGGGTAVMLIPARTDTAAFHDYIYGVAEIEFIRGRIRFSGAGDNAPFPSMIVIYEGGRPRMKEVTMYRYGCLFAAPTPQTLPWDGVYQCGSEWLTLPSGHQCFGWFDTPRNLDPVDAGEHGWELIRSYRTVIRTNRRRPVVHLNPEALTQLEKMNSDIPCKDMAGCKWCETHCKWLSGAKKSCWKHYLLDWPKMKGDYV